VMPLRGFFAALPDFDMSSIDNLEAVGLALAFAHADYKAAVAPPDELVKLVERGNAIRTSFQLWGASLANAGLVNSAAVAAMHTGSSYRELAISLVSWTRTFRNGDWDKIKRASTLDDAALAEAEGISQRILALAGYRDLNPERVSATSEIRSRMFTLAVNYYEQVRRACTFMRWNYDDIDEFAPSLYAKGPHKSPTNDASAQTPKPADAKPEPATQAAHPAADTSKPANPQAGAVGMPDSSPFLDRA
jgi:cell division septation protein DedD